MEPPYVAKVKTKKDITIKLESHEQNQRTIIRNTDAQFAAGLAGRRSNKATADGQIMTSNLARRLKNDRNSEDENVKEAAAVRGGVGAPFYSQAELPPGRSCRSSKAGPSNSERQETAEGPETQTNKEYKDQRLPLATVADELPGYTDAGSRSSESGNQSEEGNREGFPIRPVVACRALVETKGKTTNQVQIEARSEDGPFAVGHQPDAEKRVECLALTTSLSSSMPHNPKPHSHQTPSDKPIDFSEFKSIQPDKRGEGLHMRPAAFDPHEANSPHLEFGDQDIDRGALVRDAMRKCSAATMCNREKHPTSTRAPTRSSSLPLKSTTGYLQPASIKPPDFPGVSTTKSISRARSSRKRSYLRGRRTGSLEMECGGEAPSRSDLEREDPPGRYRQSNPPVCGSRVGEGDILANGTVASLTETTSGAHAKETPKKVTLNLHTLTKEEEEDDDMGKKPAAQITLGEIHTQVPWPAQVKIERKQAEFQAMYQGVKENSPSMMSSPCALLSDNEATDREISAMLDEKQEKVEKLQRVESSSEQPFRRLTITWQLQATMTTT